MNTHSALPRSLAKPHAPLWLLVMITISGTLAMHMFVPALPEAAQALGVGSGTMQMTISVYIMGLAGGQLIYGPLSDSLGRRPMLLFGLALYTLAGLAAACASGIHTLIAARLFQALGGCAGLALGRAIVRDIAPPDEAVRSLALMNLMMMIGPGLAPLLGSGLVALSGWRAIFVVLTLLGAVTLACTWRLIPETGKPTGTLSGAVLLHDYSVLLRSRSFLGYALGGGCATTSIYAFIAAAPFIVTTQLHRPLHEVGVYLGLLIAGMSVGNALTRRLVRSVGIEKLLLIGIAISVVSGVALLLIVLGHQLTVAAMVGCMFLFALGAGMSSPAALSKALGVDATVVGSAAGLYGFSQMSVGALCTFLAGLGGNPVLAAALVVSGAALVGQISFWVGLRAERGAAL
ncbi:MAG: multidrug effflux MFS transporter [Janthinobacterium lividum]